MFFFVSQDVVRKMENVETKQDRPIVPVSVADCGSLPVEKHFAVSTDAVQE